MDKLQKEKIKFKFDIDYFFVVFFSSSSLKYEIE